MPASLNWCGASQHPSHGHSATRAPPVGAFRAAEHLESISTRTQEMHLNPTLVPSQLMGQCRGGGCRGGKRGQGNEVRIGMRFLPLPSFQEARGERSRQGKPLAEGSFRTEDTGTWVRAGDCGAVTLCSLWWPQTPDIITSVSQMLGSLPSSLE